MSHYTSIKTQFRNTETLVRALVEQGIKREHIEVHAEAQPIQRYNGTFSAYRRDSLKDARFADGDRAHVIVRGNHVGFLCNDLGFYFDPDTGESIAFICDFSKNNGYGDAWQNRLRQSYARLETIQYHEDRGESVEVVEEDGEIYVYAQA